MGPYWLERAGDWDLDERARRAFAPGPESQKTCPGLTPAGSPDASDAVVIERNRAALGNSPLQNAGTAVTEPFALFGLNELLHLFI
jgi:hypothetical protein